MNCVFAEQNSRYEEERRKVGGAKWYLGKQPIEGAILPRRRSRIIEDRNIDDG